MKVGLGVGEIGYARGLRWEAGWAREDANFDGGVEVDMGREVSMHEAVGFVTWNVADSVGAGEGVGRIKVGGRASFVGFRGDVLGFDGRIEIIGDGGRVGCWPVQD